MNGPPLNPTVPSPLRHRRFGLLLAASAPALLLLLPPLPTTPWPLALAAAPSGPLVLEPLPLQGQRPERSLRVLLRQERWLELGATAVPLQLSDDRGRVLLRLGPGEVLRLQLDEAGLQALAPAGTVPLPLRPLWLKAAAPAAAEGFLLAGQGYRGRLRLVREAGQLLAINHLDVEDYLPSVVGSEMPASWPLAALQAQAIAARTYALAQRRPAAAYDVKATVASQMYRGLVAETASTREAVASTRGLVLMHGDQLIQAVFHSSSGGITENSGELWRRQLPYLVSVPDRDESSPVREWQVRFDPEKLRRLFSEIGGVQRIDVLQASSSGRVRQARVLGPAGSLLLSGSELRTRLGLRSTLVRFQFANGSSAGTAPPIPGQSIAAAVAARSGAPEPERRWQGVMPPPLPALATGEPTAAFAAGSGAALLAIGRGFGHGVGMSQWGAYGLALRGESHEQILRHYYRGAQLRTYTLP